MPKAHSHFRRKHISHPSLLPQPWQGQSISGEKPQLPATEVLPCHRLCKDGQNFQQRLIYAAAIIMQSNFSFLKAQKIKEKKISLAFAAFYSLYVFW